MRGRLCSAAEIVAAAFSGGKIRALYLTAGLGPEPPLTHTPRLHEHEAYAQAATGTFDWMCPANDNPSPVHHHPGPAGS